MWLCEREAVEDKKRGVPAARGAGIIANGLVASWGKQLGELLVWSEFEVVR